MSGSQEGLSGDIPDLACPGCIIVRQGLSQSVKGVYKVYPAMMKFCLGYLRSFPRGLSDISNVCINS